MEDYRWRFINNLSSKIRVILKSDYNNGHFTRRLIYILIISCFCTRPDRSWGPSSPLYNGYRFFPEGKVARSWRWPPTPSSTEVKQRVEIYLFSTYRPSWPVLWWTLPLLLPCSVILRVSNVSDKIVWKNQNTYLMFNDVFILRKSCHL
jgi:hypothetical protein